LSESIFLKALEIMIIVLSYFERQATVGGISRWQRQLKNPTAKAVGFRGMGYFPTSNFRRKFEIGKPISLLADIINTVGKGGGLRAFSLFGV